MLAENPDGLLLYRDELMGFLKGLEKQGHEGDRAFYSRLGTGPAPIPTIGSAAVPYSFRRTPSPFWVASSPASWPPTSGGRNGRMTMV